MPCFSISLRVATTTGETGSLPRILDPVTTISLRSAERSAKSPDGSDRPRMRITSFRNRAVSPVPCRSVRTASSALKAPCNRGAVFPSTASELKMTSFPDRRLTVLRASPRSPASMLYSMRRSSAARAGAAGTNVPIATAARSAHRNRDPIRTIFCPL
ncbi:hypothetical protein D9M73_101660 [compost metagenome]